MWGILIIVEWFVGLVLLQGLVLNHVNIFGFFTPAVYIYFVLSLNSAIGRKGVLIWAFFLGLCVDIFSNTPGLNTAATVFVAYFRRSFIRSQTLREISDNFRPDSKSMGGGPFLRYTFFVSFIHVLIIGILDTFSFVNFGMILLKALSDAVITTVCILAIDRMRRK